MGKQHCKIHINKRLEDFSFDKQGVKISYLKFHENTNFLEVLKSYTGKINNERFFGVAETIAKRLNKAINKTAVLGKVYYAKTTGNGKIGVVAEPTDKQLTILYIKEEEEKIEALTDAELEEFEKKQEEYTEEIFRENNREYLEDNHPFLKKSKPEVTFSQGQLFDVEGESYDPLIREKYFKNAETQKASDVLQKIADSKHSLNKLAKHLQKFIKLNDVDIELVNTLDFTDEDGERYGVSGVFYPDDNKIQISEFSGFRGKGVETTLLHEILHALSVHYIRRGNSTINKKLDYLFDYAKLYIKDGSYGMTNREEFFTAVFTDSSFIKKLAKLPASKNVEAKNFLEEVMDYILTFLKIDKENSLYEQAFGVMTELLQESLDEYEAFEDYRNNQESKDLEDGTIILTC